MDCVYTLPFSGSPDNTQTIEKISFFHVQNGFRGGALYTISRHHPTGLDLSKDRERIQSPASWRAPPFFPGFSPPHTMIFLFRGGPGSFQFFG
jgi:hypothetical protein